MSLSTNLPRPKSCAQPTSAIHLILPNDWCVADATTYRLLESVVASEDRVDDVLHESVQHVIPLVSEKEILRDQHNLDMSGRERTNNNNNNHNNNNKERDRYQNNGKNVVTDEHRIDTAIITCK